MSGWRVEGYYSARHGWETVTREESRAEAEARLREYRANEPGYRHRIVRDDDPLDDPPPEDAPARDGGGRLPVAGDWREPRR